VIQTVSRCSLTGKRDALAVAHQPVFHWQARAPPACQERWKTVTSEQIIGRSDSTLRDAISHIEMIRFFRVLNHERAEPETPLALKTLRQAYSEVRAELCRSSCLG